MARPTRSYVCQSCGAATARWAGRCESCGEWNTIVEEAGASGGVGAGPAAKALKGKGRQIQLVAMSGESAEPPRHVTGLGEFDRVTGGGLVPGSALLIGGDPGIGKSTLLLQVMAALAGGSGLGDHATDRVEEVFGAVVPDRRPHMRDAQLARRRAR